MLILSSSTSGGTSLLSTSGGTSPLSTSGGTSLRLMGWLSLGGWILEDSSLTSSLISSSLWFLLCCCYCSYLRWFLISWCRDTLPYSTDWPIRSMSFSCACIFSLWSFSRASCFTHLFASSCCHLGLTLQLSNRELFFSNSTLDLGRPLFVGFKPVPWMRQRLLNVMPTL